jgi:hypothetical protein
MNLRKKTWLFVKDDMNNIKKKKRMMNACVDKKLVLFVLYLSLSLCIEEEKELKKLHKR